jgi:serine/threonine protein kinase
MLFLSKLMHLRCIICLLLIKGEKMLPEGQQLSHYRIVRLLKSGGMGEVYLAEDLLLQRQVAIKVIHTDFTHYNETDATREATRLFLREAQAIAQLEQINILPVYDSGEVYISEIALMYMVMPYRREGSLKDWLRTHLGQELLPLLAVDRIVRQAGFALQHAHNRQIIHQDVKPANFLVYGEVEDPGRLNLQLADFGVAKFIMKTSESQVIRGTPAYMAPEQWEGYPVPATDQYALAVMVYELLTGQLPFVGNGYYQNMWYQHHHVEPRQPSMINPKLPKDLDGVLLRALEKKPDKRYGSVSAFAQAFTRSLQNSGDIHQTVTISNLEARTGTNRIVTLPTGRQVTVNIPAGAYEGQIIRLEGHGRPATYDGQIGAFIVTIAVARIEEEVSPADPTVQQNAPVQVIKSTPPRRLKARSGAMLIIAFALVFLVGSLSLFYVLKSYAGSGVNPTPTTMIPPCSSQDYPKYLPGCGKLALNDALRDDSLGYKWAANSNPPNDTCMFQNNALYVMVKGDYQALWHPCGPDNDIAHFSNFAYQVNMTIITGDCGGINFRVQASNEYYFFLCQDGHYGLVQYNGNSNPPVDLIPLPGQSCPFIVQGLSQTNIIAVVAQGPNFDLYVNQHHVCDFQDATYHAGAIGVIAKSLHQPTLTEVAFRDATVWTL